MKLINIGFGNLVSAGRVVAVVSPDSARSSVWSRKRGSGGCSLMRPMAAALAPSSSWTPTTLSFQPSAETVASRAAGQAEGKAVTEEEQ